MQGFNCNLPKDWIANFQNIKDQNAKILNTKQRRPQAEEKKKNDERGTNRNRKEEDDRTRKAETEERKQCWWNNPSTPPSSFAKQQIPGTEDEGEKRERPGERGLIDKKPGGRRHCPARANSSPSPCSCTTPAALPHREHPSVLH
ncbi:hypothetical protein NC652_019014 [Populus alba x Populus x berolinensis]|nr:hypothetical protein NC652_019014 [Populus alba x Populus x berolinensis]